MIWQFMSGNFIGGWRKGKIGGECLVSLIIHPGALLSSEVGEHSTAVRAKCFYIKLLVMNSEREFTSAAEVMSGETA